MAKKVLVAMSGGVDSTYVAIYLKEQGYDITGVTFRFSDYAQTDTTINDAKHICEMLQIEHLVVDFKDIFERSVFSYFIESYKKGETPNPCVICNKMIKFGALNELRQKLSLDYIATGHYIRCVEENGNYYIKKAVNFKKDQSYFLNQINKELLPHLIFPLGSVESKDKVRNFLREKNVEIAEKKDSQEICFVDKSKFSDYLDEYIPSKMGNIMNSEGKILGKHKGSQNYTVGQRKGLGISSKTPLYVLKTDTSKNIVYVGKEEELYCNTVRIADINILAQKLLDDKNSLYGKIRYRAEASKIQDIVFDGNSATVTFESKQRSVTPGQFLVIYNDDILVLGGKII